MDDGKHDQIEAPTRRQYVKYGGALIAGSAVAGCSDGEADADPTESAAGDGTDAETATQSATATAGDEATEPATTADDGGYTVEMAPMGEVAFDAVPERIYTGLPNTADMAVAAGQADAVTAVYYPEYHGTLMNHFYDRLDGVSFEWEGLTDSWNLGKEGFYELDSDVHLTDPAYASTLENLDGEDVAEIRDEIAPWFGNYYSDQRRDPPEGWADRYRYYSLWEIYERVAEVFRAGDRARALADVHAELRSTIDAGLPPEDERPTAMLAFPGEDNTFWVYRLNAPGFLNAHTRPLGATDAFADYEFDGVQTQVDVEALLETDPDAMLLLFTMASSYSIADVREGLADHPSASELSAVENDRVYAQGARYQGPLMNLFQLEMTAKQLYPEQFGAWPGYVDGEPYPEIPEDEQLFDRERVANIVNGAF